MSPISIKLLKTNVEKMSLFCLSMISMKTNELSHSLQDVDEKKGVIESGGQEENDRWHGRSAGVSDAGGEIYGPEAFILRLRRKAAAPPRHTGGDSEYPQPRPKHGEG
jgi:hypothetical protein